MLTAPGRHLPGIPGRQLHLPAAGTAGDPAPAADEPGVILVGVPGAVDDEVPGAVLAVFPAVVRCGFVAAVSLLTWSLRNCGVADVAPAVSRKSIVEEKHILEGVLKQHCLLHDA